MYQDSNMLASIRKVEAAREENAKLDPRRMTAEEKETLLKKFHPDYRAEQFTETRRSRYALLRPFQVLCKR